MFNIFNSIITYNEIIYFKKTKIVINLKDNIVQAIEQVKNLNILFFIYWFFNLPS